MPVLLCLRPFNLLCVASEFVQLEHFEPSCQREHNKITKLF